MWDLVGNPEDRVSQNEAQMTTKYVVIRITSKETYMNVFDDVLRHIAFESGLVHQDDLEIVGLF